MVVNEEVNDIQNAESWQTSISDALPLSLPPIPQKVKMDPIVKIFAGLFQRKELLITKLRKNDGCRIIPDARGCKVNF